ncbi:MAG: 4-hydroxy-tetrahydrodipicolinate reductase [Oscillospiraceae bacterium]|jgi:4-hydroxy-tetrahydrodipicolinate reductase
MLKIILSGCNGRMGQVVTRLCAEAEGIEIACGIDLNAKKLSSYPVYADPMEYMGRADVAVDFSSPSSLPGLLSYCRRRSLPLVLCTTGYSESDVNMIKEAAKSIPIFRSGNMSLGINLIADLVRRAVSVLGVNYDIEIVERHHNKKVDAPSGTALMLADAAAQALPYEAEYVYGRSNVRKPREKREIGISSVRGGTIVGEHAIIFAGHDEVIEIKHSIQSREVFAAGAIRAARFFSVPREPGIYDMSDVLKE